MNSAMTAGTEWEIVVRADVGSPWEPFTDGRAEVYASKKEAAKALREYREVGLLGVYSAAKVRPVE
jgi:hypothetical protein